LVYFDVFDRVEEDFLRILPLKERKFDGGNFTPNNEILTLERIVVDL
jgi:hypothetical protein